MSELLDDLPTAHLEFPLRIHVGAQNPAQANQASIGDWLVLGPLCAPLADAKAVRGQAARLSLACQPADIEEIIQPPAERATTTVTVADGMKLQAMWRVVNTLEDSWVDLAQSVKTPHLCCAWLYAQVVLQQGGVTSLLLTNASPTQLWINGEEVYSYEQLPDQPTQLSIAVTLAEGTNEILLWVANVGVGDVPMMAALQLVGASDAPIQGVVTLPTLLEPVARRQKLATVMGHAYLDRDVYSREQRIVLRWPNEMAMIDALTARLQTPSGRIYGEANPMIQRGSKVDYGEASQYPDGLYEVLLQPQFEEFYMKDMRVQRRIPFQVRNGKWSNLYYGSYLERRQEALEDAAGRGGDIFVEIAKCALGKWGALKHEVIELTLAELSPTTVGFDRTLLALLGWVARMGDLPDFPQEIAWALEEGVPLLLSALSEQSGILLATSHLLAGQLYAQRSFDDLNTGEWHQSEAEKWLMQWIRATVHNGLPHGESQQSFANAFIALSHLIDLARSDEVAEMAAVALDKLAYQMALQCFMGTWGGTQDECNPDWLASARLGPLGGVARLWWGQGAYNAELAATVALACAESYLMPELIAAVGLDRQQEAWLRRQDAPAGLLSVDAHRAPLRVNRSAFRTGDTLMTSVQGDWEAGSHALLWQVTMGPDSLIFGNRPACSSNHGAWRQNYWRGNAAPVRLAQWNDVLIVAYRSADSALLDFSHAYFPTASFDEVRFVDGWAMARKGNGYVALTASGGVELVRDGRGAQRELRAVAESIWLVQMGRAAHDGTFAQFVEKVLAQALTITEGQLDYATLRGQNLHFDATGIVAEALLVDDIAQPMDNFPHIASIYGGAALLPAAHVEIQYQEHRVRLDFGTPEVPTVA